jgi:hypothetical protein
MPSDLEFLLGLLDRSFPASAAVEDFDGPHGEMLRLWQRLGFLVSEGQRHPTPSCPHCGDGVPYPLGDRVLCPRCRSTVDPRHLLLWPFDLGAFLAWLAKSLAFDGSVQKLDDALWQMGSFSLGGVPTECFFLRSGSISERGRQRLLAYRNALVLRPLPSSVTIEGFAGPSLSLLEVLRQEQGSLHVTDLAHLLRPGGRVRFDPVSGCLWAGDRFLGEVPVGCKEYYLLSCLAQQLDRYVPYADLKSYVLRQTGSRDTTDEATFCQKLKGRIKQRWVPEIDRLIAASGKGEGYRLRGQVKVEAWEDE